MKEKKKASSNETKENKRARKRMVKKGKKETTQIG